jgi:hypothetical protein
MNGPRMGHLDPPFVDCHPPHIDSFFVQFSRDGTHTCLRWWCSTPINEWMLLDLIYSVNFYPSNEWCRLSYSGSIVIQKTIFMSLQINLGFHNSYVLFARMASNGDQKDHVWPGPQRAPQKKEGRQNEISTTCWVVFKCKVTNGSRKVHGVRMAFACRSFGSSCGPYKAHETYAMFLH